MKKIISMILCLALLMGLCISASAAEYTEVTIAEALDIAAALEHNEKTETLYCITGTVSDLYNTMYGNMHLLDGEGGDIIVYGLYDEDGNRFDAMSNPPAEGDVITVYGQLTRYNEKLEIVNAVLVSNQSGGNEGGNNEQPTTPAVTPDEVADFATSINTSYTYVLGVYQGNEEKMSQLYFNGEVANQYYLGTTKDINESPEVSVKEVSGGYQISFTVDGATKYLGIAVSGTHYNLVMADEPTTFQWDSTNSTFTTTIEGVKLFVGTYSFYTTLSASTEDKIGSDAYYHLHLYVVDTNEEDSQPTETEPNETEPNETEPSGGSTGNNNSGSTGNNNSGSTGNNNSGSTGNNNSGSTGNKPSDDKEDDKEESKPENKPSDDKEESKPENKPSDDKEESKPENKPTTTITTVTTPSTGVAYKLGVFQENLEGNYYFTGTSANQPYYLSTSTTYGDGVDVYLEAVEGGYRMYFMDGETKTYIDTIQSGTYVNLSLTTEPTAVYTWNTEYNTFVTKVGDTEYYMGTYNTFETLSSSKISYITSSFPCHLYVKTTGSSNVETGDSSIAVFVAMMAVSAVGAGIVISKKKEF